MNLQLMSTRFHPSESFRGLIAYGVLSSVQVISAQAQVPFQDVSTARGIEPYMMAPGQGGGIAASDYDNDGYIDVFVPNGYEPDQLYRNLGNGDFEEVAGLVGVDSSDPNKAALWFDYDGNGLLDLLVIGGDCYEECTDVQKTLRLYRQSPLGEFMETTEGCGLEQLVFSDPEAHVGGMCAGDVNNDGYLDLFLGIWKGPCFLYLNNRDGTFTDIASAAGVLVSDFYWQPVMYDFNHDGWQDIYCDIDFGQNKLWINQQDNTFVNLAPEAGLATAWNEMGTVFGDYDNDGDLDIFITNIFDYLGLGERNRLYKNNSTADTMSFQDVSVQATVHNSSWAWGCTFLDVDNDERVDLAVTNGFTFPGYLTDQSRFYRNIGGTPVKFQGMAVAMGFADSFWGSGLIALDFDRDGDQDMMQACHLGDPLRLLENQWGVPGTTNNHLVVQPRMRSGGNRFAIGAEVKIEAVGGLKQARLITAGNSFMSQEPAEAFFGLGAQTAANVLVIYSDSTRMAFENLPGNQIVEVVLGDLNASGVVNGLDLAMLLGNWGPCRGGSIYCPGDFNGDTVVNGLDLAMLLANWG